MICKKIIKSIDKQKFNIINNGFDATLNLDEILSINPNKKIVIGYVGSFYYTPESRENILKPWYKKPLHRMPHYVPRKEDWLYRSPYFFFKALDQLFKEHPEMKKSVEIRFAGNTPNWLKKTNK